MAETIVVPDLMCANCAAAVKAALDKVAGVAAVTVEVATKTVTVEGQAPRAALVAAIAQAGYKPTA